MQKGALALLHRHPIRKYYNAACSAINGWRKSIQLVTGNETTKSLSVVCTNVRFKLAVPKTIQPDYSMPSATSGSKRSVVIVVGMVVFEEWHRQRLDLVDGFAGDALQVADHAGHSVNHATDLQVPLGELLRC